MSLYVLDTDHVSLFRHGHPRVVARASQITAKDLAMTVVSIEEQVSGWYTVLRQADKDIVRLSRAYAGLLELFQWAPTIRVLPFNEPALVRYFELRKQFRTRGKLDLSIAAIALEFGAKIATRNLADFDGIPGLEIEDWTADVAAG